MDDLVKFSGKRPNGKIKISYRSLDEPPALAISARQNGQQSMNPATLTSKHYEKKKKSKQALWDC